MRYKTHLMGGALAGICALSYSQNINLNINESAVFFAGSIAGSLVPDIDHTGSYLGRRAKITSTIISKLCGHRGATHSPIIMSIFMGLLYIIVDINTTSPMFLIWLIGLYIGILSHIGLDMVTKGGVPLLYPINDRKFSLTKMKTGSTGEMIVFGIMVVLFIFVVKDSYSMFF